jgi:hypothetical protein
MVLAEDGRISLVGLGMVSRKSLAKSTLELAWLSLKMLCRSIRNTRLISNKSCFKL